MEKKLTAELIEEALKTFEEMLLNNYKYNTEKHVLDTARRLFLLIVNILIDGSKQEVAAQGALDWIEEVRQLQVSLEQTAEDIEERELSIKKLLEVIPPLINGMKLAGWEGDQAVLNAEKVLNTEKQRG